jgi:hypothetical protein
MLLICWLLLLLAAAGVKAHTWPLLIVGTIGMIQNAIICSRTSGPVERGLPLVFTKEIGRVKGMDALMDLESEMPGAGKNLLSEFFPGKLRAAERDWWDDVTQRTVDGVYESERSIDTLRRRT